MVHEIRKGTPKDVFLHLLAVTTLYASVVAFIILWWQYANVLFPDPLRCWSCVYDPIRFAIATLVIVFPVHIFVSLIIGREFKIDPEKREMRVRKWLWYITLFVSAITIIINLIILVNDFLRGDLRTQFFLKISVILATSAAVFGYYLWDLKKRTVPSNKPKLIAWIVALIILGSIIYGFLLIGSPSTQRARRFDEERISHLQQIQNEITVYWTSKNRLPAKLDDLRSSISGFVPPVDPRTKTPYEYAVKGPLAFEICAVFETVSTDYFSGYGVPMTVPAASYWQNWNHGKGRVCFERAIDPQLYNQGKEGTIIPRKIPD
jgi:hypothetical protein